MNEACLNLSVGSAEQVYQVVGIFEHVRLWPKSDLQVIGADVSTAAFLLLTLRSCASLTTASQASNMCFARTTFTSHAHGLSDGIVLLTLRSCASLITASQASNMCFSCMASTTSRIHHLSDGIVSMDSPGHGMLVNYYFAALHTLLSCLKTGTTTVADCGTIPPFEHSVVRALSDIGARGILARMMMDIHETKLPKRLQENTKECVSKTETFVRENHLSAGGRVIAALDIQQICNSSDDLIAGIKDLAERYDLGIQTHAAVNFEVVEFTRRRTGMRDIEYLRHLGILGPRLVAAHMGWLDVNEIFLMKESGAHVAHVPGSSLHGLYGSLHASSSIPELVKAGSA